MTLGERIKKYRKENVITVKEFANVLGVPTEFLKKVEAGELSIEALWFDNCTRTTYLI